MEKALAVANYFIKKGLADGKEVSPMKLQKLVYFAHGWHLALYDEPLIDEAIQAWQYGPVVPSIYHEFKLAGNGPIKEPASEFFWEKSTVSNDKEKFLDAIWNLYGDLTAIQLSNLTHEAGTPWDELDKLYREKGIAFPKGVSLDNDSIMQYFKSLRESIGA